MHEAFPPCPFEQRSSAWPWRYGRPLRHGLKLQGLAGARPCGSTLCLTWGGLVEAALLPGPKARAALVGVADPSLRYPAANSLQNEWDCGGGLKPDPTAHPSPTPLRVHHKTAQTELRSTTAPFAGPRLRSTAGPFVGLYRATLRTPLQDPTAGPLVGPPTHSAAGPPLRGAPRCRTSIARRRETRRSNGAARHTQLQDLLHTPAEAPGAQHRPPLPRAPL